MAGDPAWPGAASAASGKQNKGQEPQTRRGLGTPSLAVLADAVNHVHAQGDFTRKMNSMRS